MSNEASRTNVMAIGGDGSAEPVSLRRLGVLAAMGKAFPAMKMMAHTTLLAALATECLGWRQLEATRQSLSTSTSSINRKDGIGEGEVQTSEEGQGVG